MLKEKLPLSAGAKNPPIEEFLASLGLPKGIFPKGVKRYNLTTKGDKQTIEVDLPGYCDVHYPEMSIVRFEPKITAEVTELGLSSITGVSTKLLLWVPVTAITVKEGSKDYVYYQLYGTVSKWRVFDAFDEPLETKFSEFELP